MASAGPAAPPPEQPSTALGLGALLGLAAVGGALTGLAGGLFRLGLTAAAQWRDHWLSAAAAEPGLLSVVVVVVVAGCAALARLLVRWVPSAAGSGVPQLQVQVSTTGGPPPLLVLPVKLVGGLLALGSGMVLGREGPTVQMGATIAGGLARVGRRTREEATDLSAATGGAGLAVAAGAPVAGALFVVECLAPHRTSRLMLATLTGVGAGVGVAHLLVGRAPVYPVGELVAPEPWTTASALLVGLTCGLLGVAYNRLLTGLVALDERWRRLPAEARAGLVGALVAIVGLAAPLVVGSGDSLVLQAMAGTLPLTVVVMALLVRFLLGPLCYSVGVPGGIFGPMLVLGALVGVALGTALNAALPGEPVSLTVLGLVGMAAFFTGSVRAPLTAVVMTLEMSGTATVLVPLLLGSAAAMAAGLALRSEPVLDTLRLRVPAASPTAPIRP